MSWRFVAMYRLLHAGHWKSLKISTVTGAVFEPKAKRGSMSGRGAAVWRGAGRGASFAATAGAGITGGWKAGAAPTGSEDSGLGFGSWGTVPADLCREGICKTPTASKLTLATPTSNRRRFTRSSSARMWPWVAMVPKHGDCTSKFDSSTPDN